MADDKTKLDDLDLDDDLDLGGLDLDSMDFETQDNRKPVTKFATGFLQGVKDLGSDTNFLKKTILSALPREYSMASDMADSAVDAGKTLYDTAATEANAGVREARKLGRTILPRVKKRLPDTLGDKVEKYLEQTDRERAKADKGRDLRPEEEMASGIYDVFKTGVEQDKEQYKEQKAKELLKEGIEAQRFENQIGITESIAQAVNRMAAYQDSVADRWRRKTLELQYRQLHVQTNTFEALKAYIGDSLRAFGDIVKNTALPESQKIRLTEMSGQRIRESMVESVHDRMSNYTARFRENLMRNLTEQIKGIGTGFRDAMEMGQDLAGSAGEDDGMGPDRTVMSGNILGGIVGSWAADKGARYVRPFIERNKRVSDGAESIGYYVESFPELAKEWLDQGLTEPPEFAYNDKGNIIGYYDQDGNIVKQGPIARLRDSVMRTGGNFIRELAPRTPAVRVGDNLIEDGDQQVIFNLQTRKTINEIIPGYLSRIHHELNIIRTGDESIERTAYDPNSQSFVSESKLQESVLRSIQPTDQRQRVESSLSDAVSALTKRSGRELSAEGEEALRRHFAELAQSSKGFRPERYEGSDTLVEGASAEANQEIRELIQSALQGEDGGVDRRTRREMARRVREVRSQLPNFEQNIKVQSRLGNMESLRNLGLLQSQGARTFAKRNNLTNEKLERGEYYSKTTGRRITTLDQIDGDIVDRKGKLLYRGPQRVLGGEFMSTPGMLDQFMAREGDNREAYTQEAGTLDSGRTMGRGLGSVYSDRDTDPSGEMVRDRSTQSDASGIISEGLRSVVGSIDSFHDTVRDELLTKFGQSSDTKGRWGASEPLSPEHIQVQTDAIVTQMRGDDSYRQSVLEQMGDIHNTLKSVDARLQLGVPTFATAQGEAGDPDAKYLDDTGIKGMAKGFAKGAINNIGYAYGKYIRGTGNAIGGGLSFAGNAMRWAGRKAFGKKEKGEDIQDIYVRGRATPALLAWKLRAGHYLDAVTGKAITTLSDVRGLENPIIDSSTGDQVVTVEDIASGVYTKDGTSILKKGRDFLTSYYRGAFGLMARPLGIMKDVAGSFLSEGWGRLKGVKDIYVNGEREPRLVASLMSRGQYFSQKTGEVIRSIKDIDGTVIDSDGNVVLRINDIRKGLVDKYGKRLKGLSERVLDMIGGTLRAGKNIAMSAIRTSGKVISSTFGAGRDLVSGLMGRFSGRASPEEIESTQTYRDRHLGYLETILDILDERLQKPSKNSVHDTDGDGMREGGWREQFAEREQAKRQEAQAEAARESRGGRLGNGLKGLMAAMGLGARGGDESEDDGDTYVGADFGGDGDDKDGKDRKGKGGKKKGGFFRRALDKGKGFLKGAAKMTGLSALASGAGSLLKGGWSLGGSIVRGGLMAGGALLKGAGALAAGAGSLLSAPVVIGGALVAGAAIGGYFLYKKLTEVKPGTVEALRYAQYGFDPDEGEQDVLKPIRWLEKELKDKVSYDGESGSLKITDEDVVDYAKEFGAEEGPQFADWLAWFGNRFRPVFLTHCAAAKTFDAKPELDEVDKKLTVQQRLDYLKAVNLPEQVRSTVLSERRSPFEEYAVTQNASSVHKRFERAKESLRQELRKGSKPTDGRSTGGERAQQAVAATSLPAGIKGAMDPTGSQTDKDFSMVPEKPVGGGNFVTALPPREPGDAPQDYVKSVEGGKLITQDTPVGQTAQELDQVSKEMEETPEAGITGRRDPISSLGGGYVGSMQADVRAEPSTDSQEEEASEKEERQKQHQRALEQEAKAADVQQRRMGDSMNRNMAGVLDVLRRSHEVQKSMDMGIKGIARHLEEAQRRREKKENEQELVEEDGFFDSLFSRDKKQAPAKEVTRPVVDLQKEE